MKNRVLPANNAKPACDKSDESKTRHTIEYWFAFSGREQAIEFAKNVPERDLEVNISYKAEYQLWQTVVRKIMEVEYDNIGRVESELSRRAASVGGVADGWAVKD